MKLTKQRLIEIIKEEIQDLNESPMGRAQMYAKGMSKDALRLLTYLKKGDVEKAKYFIKDIQDAIKQIEKNTVGEGKLNEARITFDDAFKAYGFKLTEKEGGVNFYSHSKAKLDGFVEDKKIASVGRKNGRDNMMFKNPLKMGQYIEKKFKLKNIGGEKKLTEAKTNVGFSNEMGALYVSKGGGKSVELYKADVEQIIKQYKKFKSKMD